MFKLTIFNTHYADVFLDTVFKINDIAIFNLKMNIFFDRTVTCMHFGFIQSYGFQCLT